MHFYLPKTIDQVINGFTNKFRNAADKMNFIPTGMTIIRNINANKQRQLLRSKRRLSAIWADFMCAFWMVFKSHGVVIYPMICVPVDCCVWRVIDESAELPGCRLPVERRGVLLLDEHSIRFYIHCYHDYESSIQAKMFV